MEYRKHSFFQEKNTNGITLIIACDNNFNIGLNGTMLFRIPGDLNNYKNITMGKNLYCGRKTFTDMGPLKGRYITVLSSKKEIPGADRVVNSFEEFENLLLNDKNGYLVGGANIIKKLYNKIDRILMTKVNKVFLSDTGIGNPENYGLEIKSMSEDFFEIGFNYRYIEYVRK